MPISNGRPDGGGPAQHRDIEFAGPATYRIVVQGTLSERWSDRLAGLAITTTARGDAAPHTILAGPIRDQAELAGVLDALYELHLPILGVERVREPNGGPNGSTLEE
jgi:hypothetical protein